jgi:hypothetical protein
MEASQRLKIPLAAISDDDHARKYWWLSSSSRTGLAFSTFALTYSHIISYRKRDHEHNTTPKQSTEISTYAVGYLTGRRAIPIWPLDMTPTSAHMSAAIENHGTLDVCKVTEPVHSGLQVRKTRILNFGFPCGSFQMITCSRMFSISTPRNHISVTVLISAKQQRTLQDLKLFARHAFPHSAQGIPCNRDA